MASHRESQKRLDDRKAIHLVSASTTWTRVALCLPILRDKSVRQEFVAPHPLLSFRISYLQFCTPLHSQSIHIHRVVT
jgi:hypothetical protein